MLEKFIIEELKSLERGIVATPNERAELENFANACGKGSLILMQMSMNYGYKIALENILDEIKRLEIKEGIRKLTE
jgi:hypothetical protein